MKTTKPVMLIRDSHRILATKFLFQLSLLLIALLEAGHAQERSHPHGNMDIRVNPTAPPTGAPGMTSAAWTNSLSAHTAHAQNMAKGLAHLKESAPGADVTTSLITGSAEVVSAAGALTTTAPNRSGFDIVKDFIQANSSLYGLTKDGIANLHFIGESVSQASGLRMVRGGTDGQRAAGVPERDALHH